MEIRVTYGKERLFWRLELHEGKERTTEGMGVLRDLFWRLEYMKVRNELPKE